MKYLFQWWISYYWSLYITLFNKILCILNFFPYYLIYFSQTKIYIEAFKRIRNILYFYHHIKTSKLKIICYKIHIDVQKLYNFTLFYRQNFSIYQIILSTLPHFFVGFFITFRKSGLNFIKYTLPFRYIYMNRKLVFFYMIMILK